MFNKLISNLPFNPSLIGQVSFYARRIRQEASLRRLGFLFIALSMIVQLVAFMAPPEPTMARSGNDLIPGGVSSKEQLVEYCNTNAYRLGEILRNFGINCGQVANGQVGSIRSTDYNRALYSMGRLPYGKTGETEVPVAGVGMFYMRPLWSWDSGAYSTYTALTGRTESGMVFMLLFSCGNLVTVGLPQPPPPPPPPPTPEPVCPLDAKILQKDARCTPCPYNPHILKDNPACKPCDKSQSTNDNIACIILSKSAQNVTENGKDANNTTAKAGDTIQYNLSAQNTGKGTVKAFVVEENITDVLDYADIVNLHGGTLDSEHIVRWPATDIKPGETIKKVLTVKVKDPIPQTPASTSNPGTFDLNMTNVYGNVINIKLPPTVIKTTEQVTKSLPNTGPGTSLLIGFIITAGAGYFFARSRLIAKELTIIKNDYHAGGF